MCIRDRNRYLVLFEKISQRIAPGNTKTFNAALAYSLYLKFSALGCSNPVLKEIVQRFYEAGKAKSLPLLPETDKKIAIFLIDEGTLKVEHSLDLYKRLKEGSENPITLARIIAYILQRDPSYLDKSPDFKVDLMDTIYLLEKMVEDANRVNLRVIGKLLSFPPQVIKEKTEGLAALIKETGAGSPLAYEDIILSIPSAYYNSSPGVYREVFQELVSKFPSYREKLSLGSFIRIFCKFSELHWENFLELREVFDELQMRVDWFSRSQCLQVLEALVRFRVQAPESLVKMLKKIVSIPVKDKKELLKICEHLYRLGFVGEIVKANLPPLVVGSAKVEDNTENLLAALRLTLMLSIEKEDAIVAKILEIMKKANRKLKDQANSDTELIYALLEGKKPEWAKTFASLFEGPLAWEARLKTAPGEATKITEVCKGTVLQLLKVLGYKDAEESVPVGGLYMDLYIKPDNLAIRFLDTDGQNIDKTLNGRGVLLVRVMQQSKKVKCVGFDVHKFTQLAQDEERLKYMESIGIAKMVGNADQSKSGA
eukprot:TRINITY_DN8013_c0_g1_i1.p1 TRINITY_DN8013_c0_g1~~TRINITY_DN8013_c0_g1_i1.p1  ORF type:complete len:560 (-),score=119.08 TRINITY_DN8013_c0_g1_i1:80-1699(-)